MKPRQVNYLISTGRIHPIKKFPGRTGAYLFDRIDVELLAGEGLGVEHPEQGELL